jgi:hypothetical protein
VPVPRLHGDPAQLGELGDPRLAAETTVPDSFTPPNGICGSSATVRPLMWQIPLSMREAIA